MSGVTTRSVSDQMWDVLAPLGWEFYLTPGSGASQFYAPGKEDGWIEVSADGQSIAVEIDAHPVWGVGLRALADALEGTR